MAKGIIVVDMPESCDECPYESSKDWVCSLTKSDTFINYGMDRFKKRLNDCPIKPLPEKMDCQSRHGLLQEQIMVGWNMCIDEILKGGD